MLGLARSTVFGWVAKYREGGRTALAARPVPGRPPKLSGEQLAKIYDLIVGRDPRQLSFEFALWTREMVRDLVRREFGVALSVVSVGRLLRKLGLSPQRRRCGGPTGRTRRRWTAGSASSFRRSARRPPRRGPRSGSPTRPGCGRTTTPAPPGRRSGTPRSCAPPGRGTR